MSLPRLVKQYQGHANRGVFFVLSAPVGAMVAVEAISTTMLDEGTDEPQARVLFRVKQGQGQPWFWHRVTLRPSDRAALEALTLRFTRPRATW